MTHILRRKDSYIIFILVLHFAIYNIYVHTLLILQQKLEKLARFIADIEFDKVCIIKPLAKGDAPILYMVSSIQFKSILLWESIIHYIFYLMYAEPKFFIQFS